RRKMRTTLASASAIVMNVPEASVQLRTNFPELANKPIVTIPNGFDSADFSGGSNHPTTSAFRIVHAGYVHTTRGASGLQRLLGGAARGYDLSTRSHLYLLRAIELLTDLQPTLAANVEVHLLGLISTEDRSAIRSSVVTAHGYVSHTESVQ